jgi:RimJ/RimL family protein N-acetyltransferase
VLRPWRPDDDGDRASYRLLMGDPDVVRYLYEEVLDAPRSDAELGRRGALITEPGGWMNLAVELPDSGTVVGDVGLAWMGDDHRRAEIGYRFLPAFHGCGFATEAAAAVVDLAFDHLRAHRVYGALDGRNTASARVLERLGMRQEAHLVHHEWYKGEWADEVVYGVLADEWVHHRRDAPDRPSTRQPRR